MRLHSLKLRNFRCYKDETVIKFDDITAIVGRNDAGKSSLLDALNIFFEEGKLDKDDAAFDGHREDVEITCEFEDFPARAIVDDTALTTFEDEMLLNRDGRLEIVKKYNGTLSIPKASIFARAMHPTTEGYSDLLQLKRPELRARADALGVDLSNVNKIKNAPIRQAIWLNADDLRINETLIPLDTEDARRIWERLTLQLPMFALFKSDRVSTDQDPEAQDPLKSAIRDALESKREDLAAIQAHVLSETQKVANKTVEKIREMDPTLASTLSPIITPKKWESLFQTSITGDEGIPLNKRGSGTRRLILLNFFRATAESQASGQESGSVIYGIEEPETSQHPRNQRMLLSALREIASVPGRQVILTTHTPMLARTEPPRVCRRLQTLRGWSDGQAGDRGTVFT